MIKLDNKKASIAEMKRYLAKEQGYEDKVLKSMTYAELKEAYDYYCQEDY